MKTKVIRWLILGMILASGLFMTSPIVLAQDTSLILVVNRNVGFSNGSEIRGDFSMAVSGVENLASVTYKMDDTVMATVSEAPFKFRFNTSDYPVGWHNLSATAQTTDGQTLLSNTKRLQFVSAEQESVSMRKIIFPILGLVLALTVGGILLQTVLLRSKKQTPIQPGVKRNYGVIGGAVCPKCGRPFALHFMAPNIGFRSKFDRCDNCGKWSIVRVASAEELSRAEAAELASLQEQPTVPQASDEEKLKDMIDSSRYMDQ